MIGDPDYDRFDNRYDDFDPPPRLRRRCPECGAWGWHWPGCPENDEDTDRLADELADLEETTNDEGD